MHALLLILFFAGISIPLAGFLYGSMLRVELGVFPRHRDSEVLLWLCKNVVIRFLMRIAYALVFIFRPMHPPMDESGGARGTGSAHLILSFSLVALYVALFVRG
jgi:hypothetical protein